MTSSLFIIILFFVINDFDLFDSLISSKSDITQEYIPLRYFISKTFVIINPCNSEKSIFIRNKTLYNFDLERHQWKRLCIFRKLFDRQVFCFLLK